MAIRPKVLALLAMSSLIPWPALATTTQFESNARHLDFSHDAFSVFSTATGQRIIPGPTVYHGSLLIATGNGGVPQQGQVLRISAQGRILWRARLPNMVMTQPLVSRGVVLAGLGGNRMYFQNTNFDCHPGFVHELVGLSASTGRVLWKDATRCQDMASPAVYDRQFVVVSGGGTLRALSAKTGKTQWRLALSGGPAMSSPTVWRHVAYFGTDNIRNGNHRFYAINLKTHRVQWSRNIPAASNLGEASPVVAHGRVYTAFVAYRPYSFWQAEVISRWDEQLLPVASFDVAAMNAKTGKLIFQRRLRTLYNTGHTFTQLELRLLGLQLRPLWQAATHPTLRWLGLAETRFHTPRRGGMKTPGISNPPLTYWHHLVLVEPRELGTLYALDARSGAVVWSAQTGLDISNPNVRHGLLYTVNKFGILSVLDAASGKRLWQHVLGTGVVGPTSVLLTPTRLITGGATGILRSLPRWHPLRSPAPGRYRLKPVSGPVRNR